MENYVKRLQDMRVNIYRDYIDLIDKYGVDGTIPLKQIISDYAKTDMIFKHHDV